MSALGDQLLAVHDGLDAAGIPHAIGGAIALGYCVLEPRGTRDVDVNVFVAPGSGAGGLRRYAGGGGGKRRYDSSRPNVTGRYA